MIGQDILNRNVQSFEKGDDIQPVTKVIINYGTSDSGAILSKIATALVDDGRTVELTLSTITDGDVAQTIANNLLAKYENDVHESFVTEGTELSPLMELGDGVAVNFTSYSDLGNMTVDFSKAMYSDVESQGVNEEDSFPYLSNLTSKTERDLRTVKASLSVMATAIEGKVDSDNLSTLIGQYIDTQTGTAKIVLACSATYLTQTDASNNYATKSWGTTIEQTITKDEAKIALVVTQSGGNNVVNTAGIVTAINDSGSSVIINANKINLQGYLTISAGDSRYDASGSASTAVSGLEDDLEDGTTIINGGCITTGTISASRIGTGSLFLGDYTTKGYIRFTSGRSGSSAGEIYGSGYDILIQNTLGGIYLGTIDYAEVSGSLGVNLVSGSGNVRVTCSNGKYWIFSSSGIFFYSSQGVLLSHVSLIAD